MEDIVKHLFVKFAIDKRIDKMNSLILSEEKTTVDSWKPADEIITNDGPVDAPAELKSFIGIVTEFSKSIESFSRTVPFIMSSLPVIRMLHDDDSIRRFVKQNGTLLEGGDFETYQISIDHAGELTRRLNNSVAVGAGAAKLPSMFLVGLISAYDDFLAQIIRAMFLSQPGLLSSSERNISFRDLMEIGSIEVARDKIVEKEVEAVLRESHADQIKWFENKLGIPLRKDLAVWPHFIELCERRNLLTHTGGVISSQYIEVCKEHGYDVSTSVMGQALSIDETYYRRAVETILEIGNKLIQVIWRKLKPEDIQIADETLNNLCYDLIVKKRYSLAAIMLRFGLYEMKKHGSEAVRRQLVVNYANAEKLAGNKEAAEKILDNEDWTASTDQYKICVAAVKDDVGTVVRLMKPAVEAKLLNLSQFREWPVFETVRTDVTFIEAFEREFGQKLFADKQVAKRRQPDVGQDHQSQSEEGSEDNAHANAESIH